MVKREIINLHEDDFYKIDSSGRISVMFNPIPAQPARNSKGYSIGYAVKKKESMPERTLMADLINSGTVLPCFNCLDSSVALSQGKDPEKFKLCLSDTGLFVTMILKTGKVTGTELYSKILSDKLPDSLGCLCENAAARAITAGGRDLYYMTWPKKDSTHSWEIDFLISRGAKTVPIEVKSSRTSEHHSPDVFMDKYSSSVTTPYVLSQRDISKDGQIRMCPFISGQEAD